MMREVRRTAVLLLALCLGATRSAEGAESGDDAIQRGIELMHAHDYEGALRIFLDTNAREPSPKAVAEIGLAEQALGRWADAELHLTLALRDPSDRWINKYRAVLSTALGSVAEHLGTLFVDGTPMGGEIRFDGEVLGTIPLSLPSRVPTGAHELDVRADGYRRLKLPIAIASGELRRVRIALQAEPSRTATPMALYSASSAPHGPDQTAESAAGTVAWVGLVGGVILGVSGILLYKLDDQRLGVGAMTVGGGAAIGATAGFVVVRFP